MFDKDLLAKPKAELHMHIEGSLEPKMIFELAKRNNVSLKYSSVEEIKLAYSFNNLQQFLDLYYQGMSVLITEQDFYDLTYAYLQQAANDNVTHTEMFVDPQAHLERKISLSNVFIGMQKAIKQAEKDFGIKASIIVCFLRHLSEKNALECFEQVMDYRGHFIGIGLDSSELGHPPTKFKNLFETARKENLFLVAHAGEEGPAEYVWQALDILGVDRIDHGNAIITDKALVQRIIKDDIALTMCPLSNKSLKVTPDLKDYPAKLLLDMGVKITINSDDPAYFGGYINENYQQLASSLNLTNNDINKLIQNSLDARFIK
ncbi:adenosine deaminase [Francisellaceae bacterium CB299]